MTCSLGVVVTDIWDVPDIRGPSTLGVAREFPLMGPLVGSFVRLFLRCPGWSRIEDGRLSFGEDQRGFIAFGKPLFWRETMGRSEEHTSELQSLMRISYAVFCLKKKTKQHNVRTQTTTKM